MNMVFSSNSMLKQTYDVKDAAIEFGTVGRSGSRTFWSMKNPLRKKTPIERIAIRWLPVIAEMIPKTVGPTTADAFPQMPS